MRGLILGVLMLFSIFSKSQNILLDQKFWGSDTKVEKVKEEIKKGHKADEADKEAFDVVTIAIRNNAPLETIQFLINQKGNSISKMTHDNRIYLHWAAMKGNAELVEYLINKGSDIHLEDSKGSTPLVFAALYGMNNPRVYNLFFDKGINPKKRYKNGANLLMIVIGKDTDDLSITKFLSTKGLSVFDVDDKGNTAFDYASRNGNIKLLKMLKNKGVKHTPNALIFAAEGSKQPNKLELFKYLVDDLKIPVNTLYKGNNVLHYISSNDNVKDIITYFLYKNIEVNQVNNDGNIPLMNAAKNKTSVNVQLLLPKTNNINHLNYKGQSALANAVRNGSVEVLKMLIDNGADVNVVDAAGNNLGYYLVQSFRSEDRDKEKSFSKKLAILKQNGLDLSKNQAEKNTLYHLAVAKNDLVLLNLISEIPININALNSMGETALHKAALIARNDEILKYLLKKGADKKIKTEFGETAYDLAKDNEALRNIEINFLK